MYRQKYLILSILKQTKSLALASNIMRTVGFLGCENSFFSTTWFSRRDSFLQWVQIKLVEPWARITIYLYFSLYSNLPNFEEYLLLKSILAELVYMENCSHDTV